jgi:preprotein translocase subunit SecD
MRNCLTLCILAALIFLAGCRSRPPADVRYVSLGIFEVVDCKTTGLPAMSVQGNTERYCLAYKPVVDETDVRLARASRGPTGQPQLELFFTKSVGKRMQETTERILAEHQQRNGLGKLGLVIDGTLVEVPALRSTISDSLVLTAPDSGINLDQIAESLNAHLPPPAPSNGQK